MNSAGTGGRRRTLVLLPGLDGTGRLLDPLRQALTPGVETKVVAYPVDRSLGYAALSELVMSALPCRPYVLLAESFSGPIALSVAARKPLGLRGVFLSTSFAANPRPVLSAMLGGFVGAWCFRRSIPDWAIRFVMAGAQASNALCEEARATLEGVRPEVLAFRVREVAKADARTDLRNCPVPVIAMNATEDRLLRRGAARQLSKLHPGITVIDVDGPHMLLQTMPDICARHIEAVMDTLDWTES